MLSLFKKHSGILPVLLSMLSISLVVAACGKASATANTRTVQVELSSPLAAINAAGDAAYDLVKDGYVGFATNGGDRHAALMTSQPSGSMSGSIKVSGNATKLWCYSIKALGQIQTVTVPAQLKKDKVSTSASVNDMVFCSETIGLTGSEPFSANIKPLTSAVVLDILDSEGKYTNRTFTSVKMTADANKPLAGDIALCLEEARVGELSSASSTLSFDCSSFKVGTAEEPVSLGAVVLPCEFTGTIVVSGEGFTATLAIDQPLYLQAGYVKHVQVDMAMASVDAQVTKHFPYRLGIMGDSISTFAGKIPSDHRAYYPTTNAACADVDDWTKTYWGHLINDYWHCELDMNTSWSGSCVAPGDPTVVRTPFVERVSKFTNPDVIILFGGTNDAQTERQIGLGEFNYDTPLAQMNLQRRFRDSFIYVIRSLQTNYPGVQIIVLGGKDVSGEYGNSVKEIAAHYKLPYVDFHEDQNVTLYNQLHPNAAGHAYMAKKIYEETLNLFQ